MAEVRIIVLVSLVEGKLSVFKRLFKFLEFLGLFREVGGLEFIFGVKGIKLVVIKVKIIYVIYLFE